MSNQTRSTIYIGVTNSLARRISQHRNPERQSFSRRYHLVFLVYYEAFDDVQQAIARETQLKGWTRAKKNALIERKNPNWHDLSAQFVQELPIVDEPVDPGEM